MEDDLHGGDITDLQDHQSQKSALNNGYDEEEPEQKIIVLLNDIPLKELLILPGRIDPEQFVDRDHHKGKSDHHQICGHGRILDGVCPVGQIVQRIMFAVPEVHEDRSQQYLKYAQIIYV